VETGQVCGDVPVSCPQCGSWSVRRDRSLAGRMVCGRCGTPLGGGAATPLQRGARTRRRWSPWTVLVPLVALSALLASLPERPLLPSDPGPLPSGQLGR
jgi:hypothetical protein